MKRVLKWILLGMFVVAALAGAGGWWQYRSFVHGPLPQVEGTINLPQLRAPVEILRDEWGIPHIYAQNHHDLLFAQGYTQAQDRWWQMDFYRRVFTGRMGEIAGNKPDAVKVDVLMRTLNLKAVAQRDFESLDADQQALFQAFCDGVNAYISSRAPGELALQYSVLGLTGKKLAIEPWTPADSLAFGKLMGYVFSGRDLEREPIMAMLRAKLSAEEREVWEAGYPYGEHPTTISKEDLPQLQELLQSPAPDLMPAEPSFERPVTIQPDQASLMDMLPQGIPGVATREASNAWAVTGEHTTTGKALFASDPHHGIEMPGLWYEIGLHCPADNGRDALNLYGYAAAVLPLVAAGNNDHICWGLTNVSGSDALDLFELKVNPDNPRQYEWDGQWRDMEVREEVIAMAGAEPLRLEVRVSHLGPLMPEQLLPDGNKDKHWAICWAGLKEGSIQRAGIELVFARNFAEFREALRHWDYPAANIPYADVEGNIGFQQAGRFPYGPGHGNAGPLPGWKTEHEWAGFVPFDLLPHVLNPQSGKVVAANNPVAPSEYHLWTAVELGTTHNTDTAPLPYMGYRARRIDALLAQTPKHDVESFKKMQMDSAMPELAEMIRAAIAPLPDGEAKQMLMKWDGNMDTDNAAAVLAGLFIQRLVANVFGDEIEVKNLLQPDTGQLRSLEGLVRMEAVFWDDKRTAPVETREQIVQQTLEAAWDEARRRYGEDPSAWEWGSLHVYNFVDSVLGKSGVGFIEDFMNRKGIPASGGFASINNARWVELDDGTFETRTIPSYRRIIDMANFDNSIAINSSGQSAHPASEHYADQMPLWARGEYREIHWSSEKVEKAAVARLVLAP